MPVGLYGTIIKVLRTSYGTVTKVLRVKCQQNNNLSACVKGFCNVILELGACKMCHML